MIDLWGVVRRYYLLGLLVGGFTFVAIMTTSLLLPRIYDSQATFYIQREIPSGYAKVGGDDLRDHIRILKSDMVLSTVQQVMASRYPSHHVLTQKEIARRLRADSGVTNSEAGQTTKIVDLKFQDTQPAYAHDVLVETLVAYGNALKQIATETKLRGLQYLKKRLAEVQAQREKIAIQIETLEGQSGTTDIDLKNSELVKQGSTYSSTLGSINAEIASNQSALENLHKMLGLSAEDIKLLSDVKEDLQLAEWQKQQAMQEAEMSSLSAQYTQNHPMMKQKHRMLSQTNTLIEHRLKTVFGKAYTPKAFTSLDQSLGKKLIDLNTDRLSLLRKKEFYQNEIQTLSSGFPTMAGQKRMLLNLQFELDSLKSEEQKLDERIQEATIEQANLLNLGSYVVLSPPTLPEAKEYIYPLKPLYTLAFVFPVSLFLALFSMGIAEWFFPRVDSLDFHASILGQMNNDRHSEANSDDVMLIYQNLATQIQTAKLKTIAMVDCFQPSLVKEYSDYLEEDPHPIDAMGQTLTSMLGVLFAKRQIKTLLIDSSGYLSRMTDFLQEASPVQELAGYTIYQNAQSPNLYRMAPHANLASLEGLDPYLLRLLPDDGRFDLIMIHAVASKEQASVFSQALSLLTEGTVLNVSRAQTSHAHLAPFQKANKTGQMRLLGSVLYP
jgi:uncharacterized protein involved in exopolysaccharide biosynthesis